VLSLRGGSCTGGNGNGGALQVNAGTVRLTTTTVSSNRAQGGTHTYGPGFGLGGGLYIAAGAGLTVYIDSFTLQHVIHNTTSTFDPNIYGSYR
jgi:hypothetical protein